jgi:ATP-dependent Clp protease ATP-binding subunit ClpA
MRLRPANLTDNARRVLKRACVLGHRSIDRVPAAGVLAALAELRCGCAGEVLTSAGIDLDSLRKELDAHPTELAPQAQALVEEARTVSRRLGDRHVGTEHLLLSLAELPLDHVVRRVLESHGLGAESVLAALALQRLNRENRARSLYRSVRTWVRARWSRIRRRNGHAGRGGADSRG